LLVAKFLFSLPMLIFSQVHMGIILTDTDLHVTLDHKQLLMNKVSGQALSSV